MRLETKHCVKFQMTVIISVNLTPFSFKLTLAEFHKMFRAYNVVGAIIVTRNG